MNTLWYCPTKEHHKAADWKKLRIHTMLLVHLKAIERSKTKKVHTAWSHLYKTTENAWRIPWTEKPGGLWSMGCRESDTTEAT